MTLTSREIAALVARLGLYALVLTDSELVLIIQEIKQERLPIKPPTVHKISDTVQRLGC